jgi:hypothetical protein
MVLWQMGCNRTEWACRCVTWFQWESGAWVSKLSRDWRCRLPEEAHRHGGPDGA